jgi:hypothetical protein
MNSVVPIVVRKFRAMLIMPTTKETSTLHKCTTTNEQINEGGGGSGKKNVGRSAGRKEGVRYERSKKR